MPSASAVVQNAEMTALLPRKRLESLSVFVSRESYSLLKKQSGPWSDICQEGKGETMVEAPQSASNYCYRALDAGRLS